MTANIEPKTDATQVDMVDDNHIHSEKRIHDSEVLVNKDLLNEAYHAENLEHEQGVWDAVKSHPKACFWAFIMCFTIVSRVARFEEYDG